MQSYSDPTRAADQTALPNLEVFHNDGMLLLFDEEGEELEVGWYWWPCFPGCLPDGAPAGPFDSAAEAEEDAQDALSDLSDGCW